MGQSCTFFVTVGRDAYLPAGARRVFARNTVLAVVTIPKPPAANLALDADTGGGRGRVRARFALLAVPGSAPAVIDRVQACSTTATKRRS